MAYAIVRTDNMQGTYDGSKLVSFRYYNGSAYAAIENGNVVSLDSLISNQREIWKAVNPTANQAIGKLVLVAGVELMYDERKRNLDEFRNEANADVRGYVLCHGDMFSVTAEACDATPDLTTNKYVQAQAGTTWDVATAATNAVAELVAIETAGSKTYYVYRII